jgi:hypothetical protein
MVLARRGGWLAVAAILLAGCTGTPAPTRAPATASAPAPPAATAAACAPSSIHQGAPPAWNAHPAGFSGQPGLPYVLGAGDTIMGYIWGFPLRAGHPDNPSNKILWYVRLPRDGQPLVVRAHPATAATPVVSYRFPADSGPGEIYPSIVDMPAPGCWTLDLSWGAHRDRTQLSYRER